MKINKNQYKQNKKIHQNQNKYKYFRGKDL